MVYVNILFYWNKKLWNRCICCIADLFLVANIVYLELSIMQSKSAHKCVLRSTSPESRSM